MDKIPGEYDSEFQPNWHSLHCSDAMDDGKGRDGMCYKRWQATDNSCVCWYMHTQATTAIIHTKGKHLFVSYNMNFHLSGT